jgi:hypothetical protein
MSAPLSVLRAALLSRRVAALSLALVLALVATDLPVVHAHGGGTVGLYNEECPLGRLATPPSAVLADASPPVSVLGPSPDQGPSAPADLPASEPLDSHGARAPPVPDPVPA